MLCQCLLISCYFPASVFVIQVFICICPYHHFCLFIPALLCIIFPVVKNSSRFCCCIFVCPGVLFVFFVCCCLLVDVFSACLLLVCYVCLRLTFLLSFMFFVCVLPLYSWVCLLYILCVCVVSKSLWISKVFVCIYNQEDIDVFHMHECCSQNAQLSCGSMDCMFKRPATLEHGAPK